MGGNIRKFATVFHQHIAITRRLEERKGRLEVAQESPQHQQQEQKERQRDQQLQHGRFDGVWDVELQNQSRKPNKGVGAMILQKQGSESEGAVLNLLVALATVAMVVVVGVPRNATKIGKILEK